MSSMDKIGFNLGRRDEIPNQKLAKELASVQDRAGIQEIAENLWNKNTNIRGDCIKVMYEIGYLDPDLIADYYPDFIRLLISKQNRLVWGGMIALSTIASLKARELSENLPAIQKAIREGSVITVDAGIKTLALIAAHHPSSRTEIVPFLIDHLRGCRTKEVPQHAESTIAAITGEYIDPFREVLTQRMTEMTPSQAQRVKRLLKKLDST